MRKLIYLAMRNPSSTEPWPDRWRQHAAAAMTKPLWRRVEWYAQCDPLPYAAAEPLASLPYNGVSACIFVPGAQPSEGDEAAWPLSSEPPGSHRDGCHEQHRGDPDGVQAILADELEVFGQNVGRLALIGDQVALREGGGGTEGLPADPLVP